MNLQTTKISSVKQRKPRPTPGLFLPHSPGCRHTTELCKTFNCLSRFAFIKIRGSVDVLFCNKKPLLMTCVLYVFKDIRKIIEKYTDSLLYETMGSLLVFCQLVLLNHDKCVGRAPVKSVKSIFLYRYLREIK